KRIRHDCLPGAAGIGELDVSECERCVGCAGKIGSILQPSERERQSAVRSYGVMSSLAGIYELVRWLAGDPGIVHCQRGDRTRDRAGAVRNDKAIGSRIGMEDIAQGEREIG